MEQILLTPRENPYNNPTDREREEDGMFSKYEIFEAGAKAQLRKVVEFIGGILSEAKWEALLKEVK